MDQPLNAMINTLSLVYTPVSNQEADWLLQDAEVEKLLRSSDFYLLGTRAEVQFDADSAGAVTVDDDGRLHFTIAVGDIHDDVALDCPMLAEQALGIQPDVLTFEWGSKLVRLYAGTDDEVKNGQAECYEWFTTEKLIWDRSRGKPGIIGFDRFREFATYELLYIGIARKSDTYDRLFARAHRARQRILTNEYPIRPGARVSDELILFALQVNPLVMREITDPNDLGGETFGAQQVDWDTLRKMAVADAEKAFISLLDPQYNIEKYAHYPRGADGLYGSGFERYAFVLIENLTLQTQNQTLHGAGHARLGLYYETADMLVTSGNKVRFYNGRRP